MEAHRGLESSELIGGAAAVQVSFLLGDSTAHIKLDNNPSSTLLPSLHQHTLHCTTYNFSNQTFPHQINHNVRLG